MSQLKVLVSGASGFVAAWVVRTILERGHSVRGTVRNNAKGDYLKQIFKEHGDRFDYVVVEDVQQDGAFDKAVVGMDAVVHTASPFHMNADDPQEMIRPAVHGTIAILESILKHAPAVKRVVITSSTASVTDSPPPTDPPTSITYSEKDWNYESPRLVKEQGKNVLQTHKYRASKSLAEQAAWEFIEKHKAEVKWDLVTLNPPFIFGPIIHDVRVPSVSSLNTSNNNFLTVLKNSSLTPAQLASPVGNWVDVRDVAWAHAESLVNDRVANRDRDPAFSEGKGRIILCASPYTWQDAFDAVVETGNTLPETAPKGEPGRGKTAVHPILLDTRHAREVLGLKFRTMGESFGDLLADFKKRGWVS
ncbi:D-lactaldehyde dehydrogenase [Ramaria rubella]|nr:D-lactaldehyde dehydrogenase [Ramaria rubella]